MTEAGGEKAREEGGNTFILRHTNAKNAKKYLTDVTVLQSFFFFFFFFFLLFVFPPSTWNSEC